MLEIDGSYGEGGGQILRTALALSCLKHVPIRLINIRKNRRKPGLQPQHLKSVKAAAAISGAAVQGDVASSRELSFLPGIIRPGNYVFDIGTAGSTTLLFQAILPPLAFAGGRSIIKIIGGTHNPLAPPLDYVKEVFLPMLYKVGISVSANIERYGFYPKGGGIVEFKIGGDPALGLPVLKNRGNLLSLSGVSAVANLPVSIAERQRASAQLKLKGFTTEIEIREVPALGAGTFVFLLARYEDALCGFSSLGARGKRAETVGEEAATEFLAHHYCEDGSGSAALDPHLADQMALYLAWGGHILNSARNIAFTTSKITEHLLTNLWVISRFIKFEYRVIGEKGKPGMVEMNF